MPAQAPAGGSPIAEDAAPVAVVDDRIPAPHADVDADDGAPGVEHAAPAAVVEHAAPVAVVVDRIPAPHANVDADLDTIVQQQNGHC